MKATLIGVVVCMMFCSQALAWEKLQVINPMDIQVIVSLTSCVEQSRKTDPVVMMPPHSESYLTPRHAIPEDGFVLRGVLVPTFPPVMILPKRIYASSCACQRIECEAIYQCHFVDCDSDPPQNDEDTDEAEE